MDDFFITIFIFTRVFSLHMHTWMNFFLIPLPAFIVKYNFKKIYINIYIWKDYTRDI